MFSTIINKFYLVDVNEDEEDKHESAATNIEIKQNP